MYQQYIIADPDIMMGKPVIKATRITVESILDRLAAGETMEQLIVAFPRLTPAAIFAALSFAADILRADVLYRVSDKAA